MSKKNKKSHAGLIVILVILVLAVAGGTAFYLYQRQQPKKTAEQFLDSMQKMDFTTMESLLQSSIPDRLISRFRSLRWEARY